MNEQDKPVRRDRQVLESAVVPRRLSRVTDE